MVLTTILDKKSLFIMVVSSFCSKCHYNNQLIDEVFPEDLDVYEINVASTETEAILKELKPLSAPILYLVGGGKVIYSHEGVLTSDVLLKMLEMYQKLN